MILEVFSPIILFIGIIGNLINLYVFTHESIKQLSTFRFLAYLSIIDLLYISLGLPHIMVNYYSNVDFREYSDLICSLHSFFTIYLSHLSSNILAGVGIFRCVTISSQRPIVPPNLITKITTNNSNLNNFKMIKNSNALSSNRLDSQNLNNGFNNQNNFKFKKQDTKSFFGRFRSNFGKADLMVLTLMIILFLFDCHYLIWARLEKSTSYFMNETNFINETNLSYTNSNLTKNDNMNIFVCFPTKESNSVYFYFMVSVWPLIDLLLYSYIPFLVMFVCTLKIIYRLFKINRRLKKHARVKSIRVDKRKSKTSSSNQLESKTSVSNLSEVKINLNKKDKKSPNNQLVKRLSKKNNQIYKLLLTLNLSFFLMVTPIVLLTSLDIFKDKNQISFEIANILAYLNHCLNFLFYGFSCKFYRQILISSFGGGGGFKNEKKIINQANI